MGGPEFIAQFIMATPSGKPGRQYKFRVTILDGEGEPQNLNDVQDFALIANVKDSRVIAQWRKVETAGYLEIEENDSDLANGEVVIILPAVNTAEIENEIVLIEPVIWMDLQPLSSKDGRSFELIKITASPKRKLTALTP